MKNIYLIVDNESFFAHHIKFGQLNKNIIIDYFNKYKINLIIITLNELSFKLDITDSIIITLSSQKPYHKAYIDDIYEYLELNNNILIPSKHIIKAHDNKGYQELYKKHIGLFSLKYLYINKDTINYENVKEIDFPLVLKSLGGSGSKGVQLVKNELNLNKEINRLKPSLHIRYFIYLKEMFLNTIMRKNNLEKVEYFKDYDNYVIQEFIPNLTFDYKVLVFFDKFYVLKRNISKNDFRASGSGKFEFVEIEDSLLEYTESIFKQFNEPFMSLDICFDGSDYYLIEYQGIHFGLYTQINAKGFYKKENDKWLFIEKKVKLEEDIAYSLFNHLKVNYNDTI